MSLRARRLWSRVFILSVTKWVVIPTLLGVHDYFRSPLTVRVLSFFSVPCPPFPVVYRAFSQGLSHMLFETSRDLRETLFGKPRV